MRPSGAVCGNAMDAALACQGTKTANVLASTNPNVLSTRAQPTSGLASLGNLVKLFGVFSSLGQPGVGASSGGGGGGGAILKILASLVGGGGNGGSGSILPTLLKFIPKLFGNPTGLNASPFVDGRRVCRRWGRRRRRPVADYLPSMVQSSGAWRKPELSPVLIVLSIVSVPFL
jgi:hypothetical protein